MAGSPPGGSALSTKHNAARMNLDAGSLVASFVVSSVGFVLLVYGKRMSRIPHLVVGLVLFVYPYFVSSVLLTFGIGVVLLALLWILVQKGV